MTEKKMAHRSNKIRVLACKVDGCLGGLLSSLGASGFQATHTAEVDTDVDPKVNDKSDRQSPEYSIDEGEESGRFVVVSEEVNGPKESHETSLAQAKHCSPVDHTLDREEDKEQEIPERVLGACSRVQEPEDEEAEDPPERNPKNSQDHVRESSFLTAEDGSQGDKEVVEEEDDGDVPEEVTELDAGSRFARDLEPDVLVQKRFRPWRSGPVRPTFGNWACQWLGFPCLRLRVVCQLFAEEARGREKREIRRTIRSSLFFLSSHPTDETKRRTGRGRF